MNTVIFNYQIHTSKQKCIHINKSIVTLLIVLCQIKLSISQTLIANIDTLLNSKNAKPFNGVVLITDKKGTIYQKVQGFSDMEKSKTLQMNSQFVVGSVSKQFTAVIVLREYDLGHLKLTDVIGKYLPEIKQKWADSVSVHHLLTHTHGITALDEPLMFSPGSHYAYSQIGYELLARIVEKTSGQSFAKLSQELFRKCKMKNSFHPDTKKYKHLAKGYTEREGKLMFDSNSFENHPAAGSFISTAPDLLLWNNCLHGGKLLKPETYKIMITPQVNAVRNHPLFGFTLYGYGITATDNKKPVQLGQTGFAPGFVSMDFYFPETGTNVIVLENTSYDSDDLKKKFRYHTAILQFIKEDISAKTKR